MTIRTFDDICQALFAIVDTYKEKFGDDHDKWAEFRAYDMKLKYVNKLWKTYNRAQESAKKFGFVGVGCITFAEQRVQQYQERLARKLA